MAMMKIPASFPHGMGASVIMYSASLSGCVGLSLDLHSYTSER